MWQIINSNDWGAIKYKFSWIRDMEGVLQDPIFHAEGDVEIHTKMVMEALISLPEYHALNEQDKQILFASALLHDVEKRSTTVVDESGRVTSAGHAKKGEFTARKILYQEIPAPFLIKEAVAKLVRYHGLPLWVFDKPNPQKELLQASLEVNTQHLTILAKVDILGRICSDQAELLYKIDLFKVFCEEQNCWGKPRHFSTGLSRFNYFQKEKESPDYVPFDDTCCEVILLAGLPGAGKDTFIQKYYPNHPVVSLDELRRTLKISPKDKKGTGRIVQQVKEQAKSFLRSKTDFIWNATNITRQMRKQLIDLFVTYGAKVKLVYIEIPYKQLIHQNLNRAHPVPIKILEKMIGKLEVPSLIEAQEVVYYGMK